MDPEVQKIIEELRKVSSSQELADYEKQLRKSSTALGKNTSLNAIEIKQIEKEIASGFPWVEQLSEALDLYSANRDKYPDMEDYLPQLVSFFEGVNTKKYLGN